MPAAISYPGVYIEEIPSGVRTITGVATAIAAFVGWAWKGPMDERKVILSWSDYERTFGGFDRRSMMGYAVRQFFTNGGSQAFIVRLAMTGSATAATPPRRRGNSRRQAQVTAQNPGTWGKSIAVVTRARPTPDTNFSTSSRQSSSRRHGNRRRNFSQSFMDPTHARFVGKMLEEESALIRGAVVGGATAAAAVPATPASGVIPATPSSRAAPKAKARRLTTTYFEAAAKPTAASAGCFNS